ncbi:hypothetical protein AT5A_16391 [Agrobacterium tumefaciens 5A]|nr:hypothetical protein AT5A_16391 [Agrobacterium tumefaciens 5A]
MSARQIQSAASLDIIHIYEFDGFHFRISVPKQEFVISRLKRNCLHLMHLSVHILKCHLVKHKRKKPKKPEHFRDHLTVHSYAFIATDL